MGVQVGALLGFGGDPRGLSCCGGCCGGGTACRELIVRCMLLVTLPSTCSLDKEVKRGNDAVPHYPGWRSRRQRKQKPLSDAPSRQPAIRPTCLASQLGQAGSLGGWLGARSDDHRTDQEL
jgi:hypothetical protein